MIQLSPDAAFGAVTAGMFLVYTELCAPGMVLPGAAGAIGVLGGGWLLFGRPLAPSGLLLLTAGAAFLSLAILRRSYRAWTSLALFCFAAGWPALVPGPESISPLFSVPVSVAWVGATIYLGRLARMGRAIKRDVEVSPFKS